MSPLILTSRDGDVSTIVLNRPDKRNAISMDMMDQFVATYDELKSDDTKVIIIRGAGDTFSAGWDRAELLDDNEAPKARFLDIAVRFYRAMTTMTKPVIASIEGNCLGTAFDVMLLADVRVCSETANFGHPEVKAGGPCLYTPLKEVVGAGWAREMCLSGRSVDAETADKIGLVNRVALPGQAIQAANDIAKEMAEVPLETLMYTKSYLWTHPDPEEWLAAEFDHIMNVGMTIQH